MKDNLVALTYIHADIIQNHGICFLKYKGVPSIIFLCKTLIELVSGVPIRKFDSFYLYQRMPSFCHRKSLGGVHLSHKGIPQRYL